MLPEVTLGKRKGTVLGFSGLRPEEIVKGVTVLGEVLESVRRNRRQPYSAEPHRSLKADAGQPRPASQG